MQHAEDARDEATGTLRTFWKPDKRLPNPVRHEELRRWMDNHRLDGVSVTLLLRAGKYRTHRQEALAAMTKK